jgi:hypothetical protein
VAELVAVEVFSAVSIDPALMEMTGDPPGRAAPVLGAR